MAEANLRSVPASALLPGAVIVQRVGVAKAAPRVVPRRVVDAELGTRAGFDRVFFQVIEGEGEGEGAAFRLDYPPGWPVDVAPPGTTRLRMVRSGPGGTHARWCGLTRDGWAVCLTPDCPVRMRDEQVMVAHVATGHR